MSSVNQTEERQILNETYDFYINALSNLSADDYQLVQTELIKARSAIRRSDIKPAVRHLTTVFEVASEYDWIAEEISYPGPGDFNKLVNYLN